MRCKLHLTNAILVMGLFFYGSMYAQTATPPSIGDGSSGNPYQIATLDNLYWITQNSSSWDKEFLQTANIDASSTSGWDSGSGFTPIGNTSTQFSGVYNGADFNITNLSINRGTTNYIALFGSTNNASITNLIVRDVSIVGQYYVGAISGFNFSTDITNCSSSGNITGTQDVGGLCGREQGSTISMCFSSCDVSGLTVVGGFLSKATGSLIEKCYAIGIVTAVNVAGGFIGWLDGASISNCYSQGDLLRNAGSSTQFGGFIGTSENGSDISLSYSTGFVSFFPTDPTDKGFIGFDDASNFYTSCLWDIQSSGQTTTSGGLNIFGFITDDMKVQTTFTSKGWNFSTIWEIGVNSYPNLQSLGETVPVELTNFSATIMAEEIRLNWQTATEVNNYGFEVERHNQESSIKNQEQNWETIGFVEGHGNSISPKEYSFIDSDELMGTVQYRLKQIDIDGAFEYSNVATVELNTTSEYKLGQNYPNPFNPSTVISYSLATTSEVKLNVYNMLGQEAAILVNEKQNAGSYNVEFNASTGSATATNLPSGIYFYRISAGDFLQTRKMILMK